MAATALQTDAYPHAPEDHRALHAGFLRSAERFPQRPAVVVDGVMLTYAELRSRAEAIAGVLRTATPSGGAPITAVFAYRTPTAFAGVLGALFAGSGYVALNRRFPLERTRLMLERSDARALVVDSASADQLGALLEGITDELLVILPDHPDVSDLRERWPNHSFAGARELAASSDFVPPYIDTNAIAYLIFTSGSTGTPKAVQVPHVNIRRYVRLMAEHWQISEHDRLSQTFDMTFDLSVSDMFVGWERGACLICLSPMELIKPGRVIREHEITVWYAVPSLGLVMKRLGLLGPNAYPSVRLVLFCGEPLPIALAQAWAQAAPGAVIENVYGPTEVTITCALYRFDPVKTPAEAEHGVVPIGRMYPGMEALFLDECGHEVEPGAEGELYLRGPQLTPGYWRDRVRSEAAFFVPPGQSRLHYKTGDRVRRPTDDGPMTYLGRVDYQVKVSGHRVELGEIEAVLRDETGVDEVVVLGWPRTETGYSAVTAFARRGDYDPEKVRERMLLRLPDYMVPREIRVLDEIPLNVNGKFDRKTLLETLETLS